MLIRLGYDMQFDTPSEVPIVTLLNVHPSRKQDLREPDYLRTDPVVNIENFQDTFGNRCCRLVAPPGKIRLHNSTLIEDSGQPDLEGHDAQEIPIERLPHEVLPYLMNSRYCEVDLLSNTASELFGSVPKGWQRVREVCTWVHNKVTFGYEFANPFRTALNVYTERVGVCRDFQHLAITFCRALNIPARYATGYLGDIGIVVAPSPMDFSAWFEVYPGCSRGAPGPPPQHPAHRPRFDGHRPRRHRLRHDHFLRPCQTAQLQSRQRRSPTVDRYFSIINIARMREDFRSAPVLLAIHTKAISA